VPGLLLALTLLTGCYDADLFGGDPPADDDDLVLNDDDATAPNDDDSAASDDDDSVPTFPACIELPAEPLPGDDTCHAVEAFDTFEPNEEVEWQWTNPSVNGNYDQVIVAPVVINLTDDDGDGQIDGDDVPDVVFYSMRNGEYDGGITRALSGADGTELWSANAQSLRVFPNAHLAAANLLDEHLGPEIIIITDDHDVVCLDALGNELWRADPGETLARAAPAIHDMNGDGNPEVIVGRVILSNEGLVLGVGAFGVGGNQDRGHISFAVDLDDDGELEVVTGNAAYDMTGAAEWSNGLDDGYPGVADFDLDGDPEVVVVSDGGVRLQDHAGVVIWGPITIAGNGRGGPPTIADYDGDGLPEIGVANKGYYSVLDTDGAILWSRETDDSSSGMTGSSVFDFNGDGAAEVVYADELNLWVYQGSDGAVLLQEPNHTSRTQLEYPVIADIDGDNHAEIVLGSNDFFTAGWTGITVLGTTVDRGGWWTARRVWNQHAFFFSHIDEDGEVPASPEKPWLAHNSFRQNFPAATWEGYPAPDLISAADGPCQIDGSPYFAARIGNQGADAPLAVPLLALYATTSTDEVLLGTAPALDYTAAGSLGATILVPYDESMSTGTFRVRADDSGFINGAITECDETNNAADWP
jgi:hypothetical protein